MRIETKKTAAILGTAAALVASAMALDHGTAAAPGAAKPVDVAVGPDVPTPVTRCDAGPGPGAPRRTADFGKGTLVGALSSGKVLRGGGGEVFAAFDLSTRSIALSGPRPALDLALVIDRSGSMEGDKLRDARRAALGIVERLEATDRVALVQYDDAAQIVVPSLATDREGKARLAAAIRAIEVGGSTNLHAGMELGRAEVERTASPGQLRRVILLSDGQANAGVTAPDQIAEAARGAAGRGVRITSVGVGLDFNEDLMEAIAEAGRGNYHYVKDTASLEKVMIAELSGFQATVATAVELHLSPACPGVRLAEVIGYESRREGDALIVPLADLSGGDARRLLVRATVPDGATGRIAAVRGELRFVDAKTGAARREAIALAVEVSDDAAAVDAAVDRDVMARVLEGRASVAMRTAAKAYESGDAEGAVRMLREEQKELERSRDKYDLSAAQAAPAMESIGAMAADAAAFAPGSAGGKDVLKKNKAAARGMVKGK